MNRKLSYEGKELHEMTQEELKNCCNLFYNHSDKLQFNSKNEIDKNRNTSKIQSLISFDCIFTLQLRESFY